MGRVNKTFSNARDGDVINQTRIPAPWDQDASFTVLIDQYQRQEMQTQLAARGIKTLENLRKLVEKNNSHILFKNTYHYRNILEGADLGPLVDVDWLVWKKLIEWVDQKKSLDVDVINSLRLVRTAGAVNDRSYLDGKMPVSP